MHIHIKTDSPDASDLLNAVNMTAITTTTAPVNQNVTDTMRLGLRRYAKSVMVITCTYQGVRYAMSATAVSELSLDPPTMLICVNQSAGLHAALSAGADFAINMLHAGQEHIARNCGGGLRGEERFDEGDWQASDFGPPILADAQAYFVCRQEQRIDHGTHSIFIGQVVAAYSADDIDPLVYVDGRYISPMQST
jgi:flavin reductase (DIM6/NTAB) family NADH-FMN oxidoreductase RutF